MARKCLPQLGQKHLHHLHYVNFHMLGQRSPVGCFGLDVVHLARQQDHLKDLGRTAELPDVQPSERLFGGTGSSRTRYPLLACHERRKGSILAAKAPVCLFKTVVRQVRYPPPLSCSLWKCHFLPPKTADLSIPPATHSHQGLAPLPYPKCLSFGEPAFAFSSVPRPEGRAGSTGLLLSLHCQFSPLPTPPPLSFSTLEVHWVCG